MTGDKIKNKFLTRHLSLLLDSCSVHELVGYVLADFGAADFVGVEDAERRRIEVQRHQVLAADFRVSELMYVRHVRPCDLPAIPLARRAVIELVRVVQSEHRLPHDAFTDAHRAV